MAELLSRAGQDFGNLCFGFKERDDLHTVVGFITSSDQLCSSSWPGVMKSMGNCTCHTNSGVFSGALEQPNSRLSIGQDCVGHSDTDKNPTKEEG